MRLQVEEDEKGERTTANLIHGITLLHAHHSELLADAQQGTAQQGTAQPTSEIASCFSLVL